MVHLNKNQLTAKQFDLLFEQLEKLIDPKHTTEAGSVMREILGQEERIMVTKRLATIILLQEGYSLYKIAVTLKISHATANTIKKNLDDQAYTTILKKLKKSRTNYLAILQTIDSIFHLGGIVPRRSGFDRYRGLGG